MKRELLIPQVLLVLGNIISINGIRVTSPFIIRAIGNQSLMYGSITRPGSYLQLLAAQNIPTSIKKSTDIHIGKYTGAIAPMYMNEVE